MPSSWRAALRIARRDAARHRGRSLLIVVMVGLPVMLSAGLATVWATLDITPAEDLDRQLGNAAAAVQVYPSGDATTSEVAEATAVARGLGARIVPLTSTYERFTAPTGSSDATIDGELLAVDLTDPATRGLVGIEDGRLPREDDEVVVSKAVALDGFGVGARLRAGERTLRVVGVGDVAQRTGPREVVVGGPGLAPAEDDLNVTVTLLLDRSAPITRSDVGALTSTDARVLSRQLATEDGSGWSDEDVYPGGSPEDDALTALVVACVVIEVALLAGPAFAVGVRSQRRQLALLAAGGGAPADLVRTVLAGALVLGGVAAVAGAGLGVALSPLVTTGLRAVIGVRVGPFDSLWAATLAAAVLGVVAAVLAAVVPARQAARRDLVAALGDRPDPARPAWGWPVAGAVLMVLGLVGVVLSGMRYLPELAVAFATVVLVLGAVLLVPLLVGGVGRVADRLPLVLRLAARDTARQRARSAPAIAAVMAVVAGLSALAIGSASDFSQRERDYVPQAAPGQATVLLSSVDGSEVDVDAFVRSAAAAVPEHPLVPARSVWSGDTSDGRSWTPQRPGCRPSTEDDCTVATDGAYTSGWSGVLVASSEEARSLGVRLRPQDASALDAGRALVLPDGGASGGTVRIGDGERQIELPAAVAPLRWEGGDSRTPAATVIVPPALAEREQVPSLVTSLVTDPREGAVSRQEAKDLERVESVGDVEPGSVSVYVERGFTETFTLPLLLLVGGGGLLVLIGTLTATGLALVDARADLATLSAVGASPSTRRRLAAASALVVGLLGAVLGAVLGVAPGLAAARFLTDGTGLDPTPVYVVPWDVLGLAVVVVPLVAALVCGVAVRGRTPLVRRVER